MPINRLQLPSSQAFTPDITPSLANLVNTVNQGQRRQSLADLGRGLASGALDYKTAAAKAAEMGDPGSMMSLLQLGQQQAASKAFGDSITSAYGGGSAAPATSGDPRGIRNNNPLNLEASPFTQRQPGFSGSDGRFGRFGSMEQGLAAADNLLQSYGQRGINTISGIINRWAPANDGNPVNNYAQFVARKAGVDPNAPINMNDPAIRQRIVGAMAEFENGRPVQVASNDPAALPANSQPTQGGYVIPGQQGATQPGGMPGGLSQRAQTLIRALSVPGISAAQKEIGGKLLSAELEQSKLPDAVKQYVFARSQDPSIGSYTDWTRENKRAGAINIVQTGEKEYEKQSAKDFAEANRDMIKGAQSARMKLGTLTRLDQLLSDPSIYTGAGAQKLLSAKKMLKAAGIDVGDVSGPEAIQAIGNQFALELRNPAGGAGMPGALSDKDREFLQASVPGLGQTPEGNRKIVDYMKRVAQRSIDVERLRQDYVKKNGRLNEGFYRELENFSNANPLFPEAAQSQPQQRTQMAPQDIDASLANARAAIARNPAIRDSVIQRLRENGIDPSGI